MQNKKKRLMSLLGLLLLLTIGILCMILFFQSWKEEESQDAESKHMVAVITKSADSDFFKSVFAGANAAATEYNLVLSTVGADNEDDYEGQNELIRKAVRDGAEVIILSACDYNGNVEAVEDAIKKGTRVIVIDSDVNSDLISCRIGTDNYMAGQMAAQAALDNNNQVIYVGIVNYDKNTANGQQREQGFRDACEKDPRVTFIDWINVKSTVEAAKEGTRLMMIKHPEINTLATFNEWTTLGVGYAIEDMGLANETKVVAFDSNPVSVGMLETGEVDALIVQNPYAMGYLGVESAYKLIYQIPIKNKKVDTATTAVTVDNMFDEDCQKILFNFDN